MATVTGRGRRRRDRRQAGEARRWAATDLKHLPARDVASLMGWETVEMVFYHTQPDEDTMRSALESRRQKHASGE
jgi:hypothetical protein